MSIFSRSQLIPAPTGVPMNGEQKIYSNGYLDNNGLGVKENTDSIIRSQIYLYNNNGQAQNTGINMNINDTTGIHEINSIVNGNIGSTISENNIIFSTGGKKKVDINSNDVQLGDNLLNNKNLFNLTVNGSSVFNTFTPNYNFILLPLTNTNISSPTNVFASAINPSNGVVVFCSSMLVNGDRAWVSGSSTSNNYLSSFTALNESVINTSNIRSIAFGNGVWGIIGHGTGVGQYLYTTSANALTGWTKITTSPWNTSRTTTRLKFLNGQFIVLCGTSHIRISSNGTTWTELTINATNYNLQDIEYLTSLNRYVINTSTTPNPGFLYYNGNTIPTTGAPFTFVPVTNGQGSSLTWSDKLGLLISQSSSGLITYSRDGINYSQYTAPGTWNFTRSIWIDDFGGLFVSMVYLTTNNLAYSRDGFNWTMINNGFVEPGAHINYNNATKQIFYGMQSVAAYKNLTNDYFESENIYNTFNSNIIFDDTIEYKPQIYQATTQDNIITTSSLLKSIIEFNTSNASAGIYLQGTSLNNRLGVKYKINKTISRNNNVLIFGYETCRIISPVIEITSFNYLSTPNSYIIIPNGYFGSFSLSRISNDNNGTWLIDDLNIYDQNGLNFINRSTLIDDNLTVNDTFRLNGQFIPSVMRFTSGLASITLNLSDWVIYADLFINLTSTSDQTLTINNNLSLTTNFKISFYIFGTTNTTNINTINISGWGSGNNNFYSNFVSGSSSGTSFQITEPASAEIQFIYYYDTTTPANSIWVIRRV